MYVKWSGNIGAFAKMYPTRQNEYETDKTVHEIAAKLQLHSTQVRTWKRQEIEGMAGVFSDKVKKAENKDGEIKELHTKMSQLAVKNDLCHKGLSDEPVHCPAANTQYR
jgi:transposase